jgi:hypothetical protein
MNLLIVIIVGMMADTDHTLSISWQAVVSDYRFDSALIGQGAIGCPEIRDSSTVYSSQIIRSC